MHHVHKTRHSLLDLSAAKKWLLQDGSSENARQRLREIRAAIRQLEQTPYRYQASEEHPGTRFIPVAGYMVFFEVDPDPGHNQIPAEVSVLRVFGPGQSRRRL